MLTQVDPNQWPGTVEAGQTVYRASDISTINRDANSCRDRARALRITAGMISEADLCVLEAARSQVVFAWLILVDAPGPIPSPASEAPLPTAGSDADTGATGLEASVGKGGDNRPQDVQRVKRALLDLGFEFFAETPEVEAGLIQAIRLFQSIIVGRSRVASVDGRVDAGGFTWRCLHHELAPRWILMPDEGVGFYNYERHDENDQHDYGTSWLADTITAAGAAYEANWLGAHAGSARLTLNDASLPWGGDTEDHAGHETGLACDIRLPRVDGGTGGIGNPNTNGHYDREAMRAQLTALQAQPLTSRLFFNDSELIEAGLCERLAGHNDHAHLEIHSPLAP